ncbi:LuxR family two component transcriptional regulator [Mucilaginibacter frigoritolerans]|uniref:LuxR family two component transcriptional regulator n=1 Tax=Mucilaginibacter frigoritolerans TaxID=652788 RepID=A0A562TVC6_9SPHI|nr:response regulator transcription factor [Mucilaginibacter frigoritolerans]TWI97218.1 LuxR family two component transcriptional regulator [Mucilaginibacter frigoritolerans]
MKKIKLAIADDHKIFRNGLKATLEDCVDFDLVLEASNGRQLLGMLVSTIPDVILMDIKMPEMDGIQTTAVVKQQYKNIKVLALSMFNEDKYIVDMMKAGASGYLLKNAEPEEIIEAISTVYEKDYYFNEHLSVTLIKQLAGNNLHGTSAISLVDFNEREIEVLKLVCQEYSNQEIADKICLSVRTVEGYRARLFEKTRSKNLVGLVIFAVKTGIINV